MAQTSLEILRDSVPFIGPIVYQLWIYIHGRQIYSRKVDQLAKPDNSTVHG